MLFLLCNSQLWTTIDWPCSGSGDSLFVRCVGEGVLVLNLFLALLLSSFSSENLSAPDDDGEMNNLHIAIHRITRGLTWCRGQVVDFFNGNLKRRRKKRKEAKAMMKLKRLSSTHTPESNGAVIGRGLEKFVAPEEDSYMTNPNLTISVPIAPGESDVEFPEEEDEEEEEEDQRSVTSEKEEEETEEGLETSTSGGDPNLWGGTDPNLPGAQTRTSGGIRPEPLGGTDPNLLGVTDQNLWEGKDQNF
ncbi:unnamed protein product [Arctogadus glacialis]